MKRALTLFLIPIFLLSLPFTFATIDLTLEGQSPYEIGEMMTVYVSVKGESNHDGRLSVSIVCDYINMELLDVSLKIEAGIRTHVSVPEFKLKPDMKGTCYIQSSFKTEYGITKYSQSSDSFSIVESTGKTEENETNQTVLLENETANVEEQVIQLTVEQTPTKIVQDLVSNVLPGDEIEIKVTLFDQTNEIMNETLLLHIYDAPDNMVFQKEIKSGSSIKYEIPFGAIEGDFKVWTTYESMGKEDRFYVGLISKLKVTQEGALIRIENIGNALHDEDTTLVLQSEGQQFSVTQHLTLQPGEMEIINLANKVPDGEYEVIFPESEEEETNTLITINGQAIDEISTETFMSQITGAAITTINTVLTRPFLASVIVLALVAGIIAYYGRSYVISKRNQDKEEDLSHIFDDYQFKK